MTPELPRAPMSADSATMELMRPMELSGVAEVEATMDFMVPAMLLPVSPSGTGNTLMALRWPCFSMRSGCRRDS